MTRRGPRRHGRLAVALVALILVPAALPELALAGATVPRTPGIKVVGASPGIRGQVLVIFRYITCRVDAAGFHGYSRAGEYTLTIRIFRFTGFHRYTIPYGVGVGRAFIGVDGPGPAFSSSRKPAPMPLPFTGGSLSFPRYGVIAIGFPSMFNTDSVSSTARAAVAGSTTAPCYTPPRRR